ncbi:peptidoglycan editing factor PgeF [candidate division KSB1 bacterium]
MYIKKKGNLSYCKWDIFKQYKEVTAAFSTRKGGFSLKPYETLNLGFTTDDVSDNVIRNMTLFFDTLSIPEKNTAKMSQVHSDNIIIAGKAGHLGTGDGIITNAVNVFISGTFADCASVAVFEPQKKIVGLFHVGWRGLVCGIVKKGVEKIYRTYNIKPCNLLIGIGPHIKSCCFEIGKDVADIFDRKFLIAKSGNKQHLQIEDVIISQLCSVGVLEKNIERSDYCTSCNNELFFSHRKSKGKTGRMMAVIGIIS